MFKAGDVLICINDDYADLTAGMEYVCIRSLSSSVVVVDDTGEECHYFFCRFKKKEDMKAVEQEPYPSEAFLLRCYDDFHEVVNHGQKECMETEARKLLMEYPDRKYKVAVLSATFTANVIVDIEREE